RVEKFFEYVFHEKNVSYTGKIPAPINIRYFDRGRKRRPQWDQSPGLLHDDPLPNAYLAV
ncbi:MAG: hypothetical protein D6722_09430, partial [Bacteroidetes bacterium]